MRTTLAIDDDVLVAVRAIALQQRKSLGEVVSDLARRALRRPAAPAERNGIPLLPVSDKATMVTLETVNTLRDVVVTFLRDPASRTQVNRILDPNDGNVTIDTLQRAAAIIGRSGGMASS
jgi:hypothetical protein